MAKAKKSTVFFCQECGFESTKWMGQCPGCKAWNSFVEETVTASVVSGSGKSAVRKEAKEAITPIIKIYAVAQAYGETLLYTDKDYNENSGICPDHQKPYRQLKEENYYLRIADFKGQIREAIETEDFEKAAQLRDEIRAMEGGENK